MNSSSTTTHGSCSPLTSRGGSSSGRAVADKSEGAGRCPRSLRCGALHAVVVFFLRQRSPGWAVRRRSGWRRWVRLYAYWGGAVDILGSVPHYRGIAGSGARRKGEGVDVAGGSWMENGLWGLSGRALSRRLVDAFFFARSSDGWPTAPICGRVPGRVPTQV
jgi:hypothetical protein